MEHTRLKIGIGIAAAVVAGCGSAGQPTSGASGASVAAGVGGAGGTTADTTTGSGGAGAGTGATTAVTATATAAATSTGTGGGGGSSMFGTCFDEPPPGAKLAPAPKAYSGGVCPALVAGDNTITSYGNARKFMLALPANILPTEKLPVVFLWHWLGGSPQDFYDKAEVQAAVDQQRFIAVIPYPKGDALFKWPFESFQTELRMDEEFDFFDDMLSCVSQGFTTNPNCVSSVGVSAGALFTDQLAGGRGDYLSSILSLSGGVDGLIRPWGHPVHHMPALVLWGGMADICIVINFEQASQALEKGLEADGNFFLECIHNCAHSEPPFDPPPGMSKFAGMWQFVFDHPFWAPPGKSPYTTNGLPPGLPTWCGIGAGSAVERVGVCGPKGC